MNAAYAEIETDLKKYLRHVIERHVGRNNPIMAETMASSLDYSDDRLIRKAIAELIDDGFPVCSVTSEPAGYFFPASVEEARIYSKSLQKRAVRIFLRRRGIIRNTARYYEEAKQVRLL